MAARCCSNSGGGAGSLLAGEARSKPTIKQTRQTVTIPSERGTFGEVERVGRVIRSLTGRPVREMLPVDS